MTAELSAQRRPSPPTWRVWTTALFVLVLLSPWLVGQDGLPLSRYPMYAVPRSPNATLIVPVGIDDGGTAHLLSPRTIATTTDPLIAESWLRDSIDAGRTDSACAEIAGRIANPSIERVEIRLTPLPNTLDRSNAEQAASGEPTAAGHDDDGGSSDSSPKPTARVLTSCPIDSESER